MPTGLIQFMTGRRGGPSKGAAASTPAQSLPSRGRRRATARRSRGPRGDQCAGCAVPLNACVAADREDRAARPSSRLQTGASPRRCREKRRSPRRPRDRALRNRALPQKRHSFAAFSFVWSQVRSDIGALRRVQGPAAGPCHHRRLLSNRHDGMANTRCDGRRECGVSAGRIHLRDHAPTSKRAAAREVSARTIPQPSAAHRQLKRRNAFGFAPMRGAMRFRGLRRRCAGQQKRRRHEGRQSSHRFLLAWFARLIRRMQCDCTRGYDLLPRGPGSARLRRRSATTRCSSGSDTGASQ